MGPNLLEMYMYMCFAMEIIMLNTKSELRLWDIGYGLLFEF